MFLSTQTSTSGSQRLTHTTNLIGYGPVWCMYVQYTRKHEWICICKSTRFDAPMGRSKSDVVLRLGSGAVGCGFALSFCPTMVSSAFFYFLLDVIGVVFLFSHYSYEFTSYKLWLHKLYVLKLMCFIFCFVFFSHGFFRISIPTKLHKVLAACVVQCSCWCWCCCQWNRCLSSGMLGMILAFWCKRFLIKIPNNHM